MLIDVIIPTYNRSHVLDRAIISVLNQTYKDFFLYVVNDGSNDQTEAVISKYLNHPRVKYLKQDNQGVSSARNAGIKSSHSDWLAFLDSDDEWLPEKLSIQVDFARRHPETQFIHSNEIWIRNGVRVNPKNKFDKSNQNIFKRSLETCLISPSTVMLKRSLCHQYGNFDEKLEICEDYDLWIKILSENEIGFISDFLIKKYGGHADQLSTKYPAMDYWRIKSLLNLLIRDGLSQDQACLIRDEIKKKSTLLLNNYLKYQNLDKHAELQDMLIPLKI